MAVLLGILLFSFLINFGLLIPFINLLYRLKLRRKQQKNQDMFGKLTPIFDRLHQNKAGTPIGGGLLNLILLPIVFAASLLIFRYFWLPITSVYPIDKEIKILLFTFLSFGLLGLYDDVKKTLLIDNKQSFGLRFRHKLILQIILALIIAVKLFSDLKIEIVNIPFFGVIDLGFFYIPFAAFTIVSFANAFNISDGLDGLAAGLLIICLTAFWVISSSILDAPLAIFITVWLGGLIAFLYFNVHPARIFLGDTGALAFGATLALIGLILGKVIALLIIAGVFVAEVASSLAQLLSKKYLKRKLFSVSPLHLWFQVRGWEECKVVIRFWIIGIVLAVFGLFLASMTTK